MNSEASATDSQLLDTHEIGDHVISARNDVPFISPEWIPQTMTNRLGVSSFKFCPRFTGLSSQPADPH